MQEDKINFVTQLTNQPLNDFIESVTVLFPESYRWQTIA